ncbi:alpha-N-arabinofuranosidase [Sphingomonas sp. NPDC019816]|uniref:alpha-N-arabinofuranosidase n=1 Tax=unclassified Sphingomonas TaxID=196159 RepID=UPI003917EE9F
MRSRFRHLLCALAATAGAVALPPASSVRAQVASPAATVTADVIVNVNAPGPVIDRHIYGQFAEHLGRGIYEGIWVGEKSRIPNIRGYRKDVVEALRHIHVPVIRWPGGCFSEIYDWRDGIGPRKSRPTRVTMNWPNSIDTNQFGTHEFLDFAELIGADAYVSGNVGSMTPRDMAQWIEYMTSDQPESTLVQQRKRNGRDKAWRVPFFGIGNETWGCGGDMRPEYAADVNARYAIFARAPAGYPMVKVASGASVQGGGDFEKFTEAMMAHPGQTQALSFHYYAMPDGPKGPAVGFDEAAWATELALARRMEPLVTRTEAIMDRADPKRKISLFVDEWGSWYLQPPEAPEGAHYQQNSLRDAMVAALTLDIFHRHTARVRMANIAQMVNVLQAMILTDKEKMILTPTYHVFDMYQPFMDATPFPASVAAPDYRQGDTSMPMIDVSAARGKDGRLYLALVNVDPTRAARVNTNLAGQASGRLLTAARIDDHNDFDAPDVVRPVPFAGRSDANRLSFDLPAKSIAVVAVEEGTTQP